MNPVENNARLAADASPTNDVDEQDRYARLRLNDLLRGPRFDDWKGTHVFLVGAGVLASRIAPEVVRSGARVTVCDPEVVRITNTATALLDEPGVAKAIAVRAACERIRPGACKARPVDVRQLGLAELARADLLVDATDDPNLAPYLTEVSNGLRIPLFRVAVSGDGGRQLARVLVSHGGAGGSCQLCGRTHVSLVRTLPRTPCPGAAVERPPTITTNGTALVAAGMLVHQLLSFVGDGPESWLDRETYVDLTEQSLLRFQRPRDERCPSGHVVWTPVRLPLPERELSLLDVLAAGTDALGTSPTHVAVFGHPAWTLAACACGREVVGLGTFWNPPLCPTCGESTDWLPGSEREWWLPMPEREWHRLAAPVRELGIPRGSMFVARAGDRTVRLLADLADETTPRDLARISP